MSSGISFASPLATPAAGRLGRPAPCALEGMAEVRAVVIKTGVVSRLVKELAWYEAETADEAAKTERLRAAGACPHDVKQQVRGDETGGAALGVVCCLSALALTEACARHTHAGVCGVRVRADGARLPAAPAERGDGLGSRGGAPLFRLAVYCPSPQPLCCDTHSLVPGLPHTQAECEASGSAATAELAAARAALGGAMPLFA